MKKFILLFIVLLISCNGKKELEVIDEKNEKNEEEVIKIEKDTLETDSKSEDNELGSLSERTAILNNDLISMLAHLDEQNALDFAHMNINRNEVEEIKNFSIENLNKSTKIKTIEYVNEWLFTNIAYYEQNKYGAVTGIPEGRSINDPYETFKHRKAICYGFSNLMKVILNALDIPAVVVSGWYISIGENKYAHSWIIAKGENGWVVADPTRDRFYGDINNINSPHMWGLLPTTTDIIMFEKDNINYDFSEGININSIKGNPVSINLPDKVNGLKITSFNPKEILPNSLISIKLSKNISFLGENTFGLNKYGNNLKSVEVVSENSHFNSYEGVLYKKDNNNPIYIPHKLEELILKPQQVYEKNVVTNRNYITSITFPKGTKRIKPYAVEHCPNLRIVKVPQSTVIEENAFSSEGEIKIIRY